jgi:DNA-binding XRE family transcriptional regulator
MARNEEIRDRAVAGEHQTKLAREYGLSKQRVWQIVHIEKSRAQLAAHTAYRQGKLNPPTRCQGCGKRRRKPLQKHHPDYAKPLEVQWLCRLCHPRTDSTQRGRHYKTWVQGV